MFVYGICARSGSDSIGRIALPGIHAHNPSARLLARTGESSIHAAYNSILAEASGLRDLEGLVLLHDDVEIRDPQFENKLRTAFRDPESRSLESWAGRGTEPCSGGPASGGDT